GLDEERRMAHRLSGAEPGAARQRAACEHLQGAALLGSCAAAHGLRPEASMKQAPLPASPVRSGWRSYIPASVQPYFEPAPLAALFLGVSSGAPYAMIAATLTTRLAQDGINKRAVTAFTLAFLVYNLKWLWAWVVDGVRLPLLGRLGHPASSLLLSG